MTDGEPTGFGEVSVSTSETLEVSEEEEDKDEDTELGNSDDEEDMDDINHAALPKETVRPNSPTMRPQTVDIWKQVRCIVKHDVSDHAMKTECTHVCVYRLEDGENGEKRYCNTPLKLFRDSNAKLEVYKSYL
jgi:HD-GYP domain-containing protein (c-di-GMP phosphodiesterase class II)